jgi:hypothetical protein
VPDVDALEFLHTPIHAPACDAPLRTMIPSSFNSPGERPVVIAIKVARCLVSAITKIDVRQTGFDQNN